MIKRLLPIMLMISSAGLLVQLQHPLAYASAEKELELKFLGRYQSGIFGPDRSAAESLTHDPETQRLFIVNVAENRIDVLDISDPKRPEKRFFIDLAPYGSNANSVAVYKGIVAVAVQNVVKTDPGLAVFFDADGRFLNKVQVGALPDMITFTPDGKKVLVANEGEPNDDIPSIPRGR